MNCGYKLYRKEVTKSLNLYGDMHRYIPALVSTLGFKITEIPVNPETENSAFLNTAISVDFQRVF